jgi:hypothetical protein
MKRREFITLLAVRLWHGRLRHGGNGRRCRWLAFFTAARPKCGAIWSPHFSSA